MSSRTSVLTTIAFLASLAFSTAAQLREPPGRTVNGLAPGISYAIAPETGAVASVSGVDDVVTVYTQLATNFTAAKPLTGTRIRVRTSRTRSGNTARSGWRSIPPT